MPACKHGGTCHVDDHGNVQCDCPLTHDGIYCENGKLLDVLRLDRYMFLINSIDGIKYKNE